MDTSLGSVLFGKTRQALLSLIVRQPEQWFFLREIARKTDSGLGAVQRELAQLTAAGILERQVRGRQVFFRANRDCPIFSELVGLVVKTVGVIDVLKSSLESLSSKIQVAFVYGSWARGEQKSGSDIDVLVVSDASFAEVVAALRYAQETLGRDINPTVYSPQELRKKLSQRHHFLTAVWHEPKLFVIGGNRELKGLAQERLAGRSQADQARNSRSPRRRRSRPARLPGSRTQR